MKRRLKHNILKCSQAYILFLPKLSLEYKIQIPEFIKKGFPFQEYSLNTEEETFEDVIFMSNYNYLALYKSIALQKEEYLLVKNINKV